MRATVTLPRLIIVTVVVSAIVFTLREMGFGVGLALGATPASAVAIAAAILFGPPGALAGGLGYVVGGALAGLTPAAALADGAIHAVAALLGASVMHLMARRRAERTFISDWTLFMAGLAAASFATSAGTWLAARAGAGGADLPSGGLALLALVCEPLGIATFGAVLANLHEAREALRDWRSAAAMTALATALVSLFAYLLHHPVEGVPVGWAMLFLSLPLSLLVSLQPRSFVGALVVFVAVMIALVLLLGEVKTPASFDYAAALVSLTVLVISRQLIHMVNRDRIALLAEMETRIAERTQLLEAMTLEAQQANEAKSRLLATVSHEVRNPLNGVLGMTAVVLAGPLEPAARRNVEIIRASGLHLLEVINRILDFSRLESVAAELESEPFNLGDLAEEVLGEARFLSFAGGLTLSADFPPDLPLRRIGPRRALRQVLTNLVANACRFTDEGGVTLRARQTGEGRLRIEVEDTGRGVPAEEQVRIFRPFEQAGERRGGTGLGLAICAEMIERMGGRIGVRSAPGQGALFWFEVPLPEDVSIPLIRRA